MPCSGCSALLGMNPNQKKCFKSSIDSESLILSSPFKILLFPSLQFSELLLLAASWLAQKGMVLHCLPEKYLFQELDFLLLIRLLDVVFHKI